MRRENPVVARASCRLLRRRDSAHPHPRPAACRLAARRRAPRAPKRLRPSPGPTATTSARARWLRGARAASRAAGRSAPAGPTAIAARFSGATATVTSPAPTRRQASPARRAAPGMPSPLPTMSTRPKSPLCAARRRRGSACTISAPGCARAAARIRAPAGAATSRSSKKSVPANSGPSPMSSPVLRPTNVTVQSARTASPSATPRIAVETRRAHRARTPAGRCS